mgnify:CR=1 FL=1
MSQVEVTQLAQNLPAVLAALTQGDEIVLTEAQVPIAKLVKIPQEPVGRVPGSAAGLFTMSEDFDEPLDDLFTSLTESEA